MGGHALLIDDEVARRRERARERGIARLELSDAHRVVADAGVPRFQELLARMRPLPRHQDLELHPVEASLATPAFGEPDELAPNALASVSGVGDQHPEL